MHDPGTDASVVHALYLPPISESVFFRIYLQNLDTTPFMAWWIASVRPLLLNDRLYIICHTDRERSLLEEVLRECGSTASVYKAERSSLFGALAEVLEISTAVRVIVLPLGAGLAPEDLLRRAYDHHLTNENGFTFIEGFPVGATPAIFERKALTASTKPLADRSNAEGSNVRRKSVAFQAATSYGMDTTTIPKTIQLETPLDFQILTRVLSRVGQQQNGFLLRLQAWRQEILLNNSAQCDRTGATPETRPLIYPGCPKRILYVNAFSGFAGAEQVLCDLVHHVDRNRFELCAITPLEGTLTRRLRDAEVRVTCSGFNFVEERLCNFNFWLSFLKQTRPDLIHQNGPGGMPLLYAAKVLDIPTVLHAHLAPEEVFAEYALAADSVVAVSNFVRQSILQLSVPDNIRVIHNGIDCNFYDRSLFERTECRRMFRIPPNAKVVVMVARFDPQKRHDLLLKAARAAAESVESFHLVLVGESFGNTKHHDAVREMANASGLGSQITWIPFVEDLRPLYVAADVLALCSDREPFGRCVAEAMAMEVPVVATGSGGVPEFVSDQETGFLIQPGDAHQLASALIRILTNPGLARRLAHSARLMIRSTFSITPQAQSIMELYDTLLSRQHAEAAAPMHV
jgi:glycosyltransferase involved in cell wall biosynthesis/spore coat polysaccharide biosynthesis protein SpsF (cytidylyltransferase family)